MRFFKNDMFDYNLQLALGSAYYGGSDVGEVLATAGRTQDGDFESWYREWYATAERVRGIAEQSAAAGHRVSAREAYLRASAYYFFATNSLDGTSDPSRLLPTWQQHRACFDAAAALWDPPFEKVAIPYEKTKLVGYVFKADDSGRPRPTLILNNGSDGPISYMWIAVGAAATARGYNAITFDGPGQGEAVWIQHLPFRYDWEHVVTPVVDYLLTRSDVDPERIAISGLSQAGYWVPRAVAFERRIAAAVVDPGVVDVSTAWLEQLPMPLRKLLDAGNQEQFDRELGVALQAVPAARQTAAFRMKPFGTSSFYEAYKAVGQYRLDGVVDQIRCPMLITDPEGEQFWPGQSQQLYDGLRCPKTLVRFTATEGADWHCEPKARSLVNQRVFDWLDVTLGALATK